MSRRRGSRKPRPKPGELIVWYGSLERYERPDLVASWGGQGARKEDGGLVLFTLNPYQFMLKQGEKSLLRELEARGYDLHSLEFRIRQKAPTWRSIVEG